MIKRYTWKHAQNIRRIHVWGITFIFSKNNKVYAFQECVFLFWFYWTLNDKSEYTFLKCLFFVKFWKINVHPQMRIQWVFWTEYLAFRYFEQLNYKSGYFGITSIILWSYARFFIICRGKNYMFKLFVFYENMLHHPHCEQWTPLWYNLIKKYLVRT